MKLFKRKRCDLCHEKCPMIPFICECGRRLCDKHRYSLIHICFHDQERKIVKIYDPKIVAEKIDKI